jgi:hypothetical protein
MRARTRYACFVWNQLGRYPADQAVTCWYKVPQAAQRAADRLNRDEPNTYVVRSMTLPPFPAQDTKETAP